MNVTAEERIMYSVMKAVYDSGIPISFKGSMVLKACLFEAGFLDETRHTVDIDANWNTDTPPTAEQMVESLQRAINRNLKLQHEPIYETKTIFSSYYIFFKYSVKGRSVFCILLI